MEFMKKHKFEIILAIAITLFIAVFSFLSIKRYTTLHSYYYDLGIMNQVVDNTSRGRFLEMTNQQLGKNVNRLAIHFDPILAVFAPFYLLVRDPSILLAGQAIILGLGALAVYLLGLKIIRKKPISLVMAVLFLLYFQVQRAVLFDFHAVVLSTTFLLFAFYFREAKKNLPYFLFLLLALLTKEHVGLVVMMLGIYIIFVKKEFKVGLATIALGLAFFVATVYVAIPYFRQQDHFALRYFEEFGDSPSKIFINVFTHPLVTLRKVFSKDSIDYFIRLVNPMFYALFSPLTFLISLPEWAINTLSINANMRGYYFHYSSLIVPTLFYGLILGYRNFDKMVKNGRVKTVVFALFIIANAVSFYRYNPVPGQIVRGPARYPEIDPIKKKSLDILRLKLKDENIRLSTTPRLAPFFTNRKSYHNFLFDSAFSQMGQTEDDVIKSKLGSYQGYDYVIIDREEIKDLASGDLTVKFYVDLRENKDYFQVATDDHDIEVYTKETNRKSSKVADTDF
jgi:uncharacterized membrane protein